MAVKLCRISIRSYKALDELDLHLPGPNWQNAPDVIVLGSKNGFGKTSILECCSLLFYTAIFASKGKENDYSLSRLIYNFNDRYKLPIDPFDLMIRAGQKEAHIVGEFAVNETRATITLELNRKGGTKSSGDLDVFQAFFEHSASLRRLSAESIGRMFLSISSLSSEPLILPPFLYFNSYRKVQEGSPELGMMVEPSMLSRRRFSQLDPALSAFKVEILKSMMGQADLFERIESIDGQEVIESLNGLIQEYANGKIEKLRPSADNTIEFRITPVNGGPTFSFDGLSSGQKEAISTLFLIWRYTCNQPGIVLIDEPELHLNIEWHGSLVRRLFELQPLNQYILATHSEDIFGSVDENKRLLIK